VFLKQGEHQLDLLGVVLFEWCVVVGLMWAEVLDLDDQAVLQPKVAGVVADQADDYFQLAVASAVAVVVVSEFDLPHWVADLVLAEEVAVEVVADSDSY